MLLEMEEGTGLRNPLSLRSTPEGQLQSGSFDLLVNF